MASAIALAVKLTGEFLAVNKTLPRDTDFFKPMVDNFEITIPVAPGLIFRYSNDLGALYDWFDFYLFQVSTFTNLSIFFLS